MMRTMTIRFGKKQKRGVWSKICVPGYIVCSECNVALPEDAQLILISRYYYCPKCGAKMTYEGENNETN